MTDIAILEVFNEHRNFTIIIVGIRSHYYCYLTLDQFWRSLDAGISIDSYFLFIITKVANGGSSVKFII